MDHITSYPDCQSQILVDTKFSWRDKKLKSFRLAKLYEVAGNPEYALRAAGCSSVLQYGSAAEFERKLVGANFCHLRLCPICSARRARLAAVRLSKVLTLTQQRHRCQFIFLTLTVRNVPACRLRWQLDDLQRAWHQFNANFLRFRFPGWFRALEITYSRETGFHPHFHVVLAVEDDYFTNPGKYASIQTFVSEWRKALHVDYDPVVYIEKTDASASCMGQALEAAKYSVKDSEFLKSDLPLPLAANLVDLYTSVLFKRRLLAMGGWLRQAAKELSLPHQLDQGDLVSLDDEPIRRDLLTCVEEYHWDLGSSQYLLVSRLQYSDGEARGEA